MKHILYSLLATILLSPTETHAVGNLGDAVGNLGNAGREAGTNQSDLSSVFGSAINVALTLVGLIFLVLMVYAGYLWMTARGDSEQVGKARNIIITSIVGLVIVMSAYAITALITSRFAGV
jgi:predicted permease